MSEVLDHIALRVSDLAASRAFYEAALAPLRFGVLDEFVDDPVNGTGVSFGREGADDFAIHEPSDEAGRDTVTTGLHVAFRADGPEHVAAFHDAAVAHGGLSIGAPGPRPEYSARYYGAFVLDPDGNNVEAVWHAPTPLTPDA